MSLARASEAWKSWPLTPGADFYEFHAGRCGWCGSDTRRLVEDHCHATGLIRGLLCRPCNSSEGWGPETVWGGWRGGDNPAAALGIFEVYVSAFGDTPLSLDSPLSYYTRAERAAWWSEVEVAESWPEAPWTDAAKARREVETAALREAAASIPGADSP